MQSSSEQERDGVPADIRLHRGREEEGEVEDQKLRNQASREWQSQSVEERVFCLYSAPSEKLNSIAPPPPVVDLPAPGLPQLVTGCEGQEMLDCPCLTVLNCAESCPGNLTTVAEALDQTFMECVADLGPFGNMTGAMMVGSVGALAQSWLTPVAWNPVGAALATAEVVHYALASAACSMQLCDREWHYEYECKPVSLDPMPPGL